MHRTLVITLLLLLLHSPLSADDAAPPDDALKILDGKPTRLYFTGNPHHPTFGRERLAELLNRHFHGKSPVRVDGLADARKDPATGAPIKPAKLHELIRFVKPVLTADRPADERVIVLTYAIVEQPRTQVQAMWVDDAADALAAYAHDCLELGASRVFLAEMVQPSHIQAGKHGNKFRRAGLAVFDELERRAIPGVLRGPKFQELMEDRRQLFSDDRHYSRAGKDYMGYLWFEALLKHDGLPVPPWFHDEIRALLEPDSP